MFNSRILPTPMPYMPDRHWSPMHSSSSAGATDVLSSLPHPTPRHWYPPHANEGPFDELTAAPVEDILLLEPPADDLLGRQLPEYDLDEAIDFFESSPRLQELTLSANVDPRDPTPAFDPFDDLFDEPMSESESESDHAGEYHCEDIDSLAVQYNMGADEIEAALTLAKMKLAVRTVAEEDAYGGHIDFESDVEGSEVGGLFATSKLNPTPINFWPTGHIQPTNTYLPYSGFAAYAYPHSGSASSSTKRGRYDSDHEEQSRPSVKSRKTSSDLNSTEAY
ncbi:hypothetical protein C8F01DRAFT_27743 [Mycena amicta]|nr:hypothetical protein C8F01DRAFT_27743 [Mycena amicta]